MYKLLLILGIEIFFTTAFAWSVEIPPTNKRQQKSLCLKPRCLEGGKQQRIGSSTVGSDEMLWLILTEAKNLQRLVAVSYLADNNEYSRLRTEFKKIPFRIGSSLESLVRARPDLVVLASFNKPELLQQVKSLGIRTLVLPEFRKLNDIKRALKEIGNFIGEQSAAESVLRRFDHKLKELQRHGLSLSVKGKKPSVLAYSLDHHVIGTNTLADDMIKLCGGVNALEKLKVEGWPKLGVEALMGIEVDHLITGGSGHERLNILASLKSDPASARWKASQFSSLTLLESKDMNSISPYIIDSLEQLQGDLLQRQKELVEGKK